MECLDSQLKDAKLLTPQIFGDDRGFFFESFHKNRYNELLNNPPALDFCQDNHCASGAHVLRGLHLQKKYPQGKLIRVITGEIYDVIVDLRKQSSTFGQWQGFRLSADNKQQLWVPPGFAHGYYTLSDKTEILYKCTDYYHPEDEHTLLWDDPTLAIDWPLLQDCPPQLSSKDKNGVNFANIPTY